VFEGFPELIPEKPLRTFEFLGSCYGWSKDARHHPQLQNLRSEYYIVVFGRERNTFFAQVLPGEA
jgi:hypothetical protein